MHMFKNLILPINDIFQEMLKTCLRIALENNLKNKQDAFKKKTNWKIPETLISYWKGVVIV